MTSSEDYTKLLASESSENDRLRLQHKHVKRYMGGRLVYTPTNLAQKGLRILDVATSDGFWLQELKPGLAQAESCTLIGTDVTVDRTSGDIDDDIKVHQQDTMADWPQDWLGSFDLVHQRFALLTAMDQQKACLSKLVSLVKPGGWLQLVELEDTRSDDPNGPFAMQWDNQLHEIAKMMGTTLNWPLKDMLREAGLTKVGQAVSAQLHGAADPDPDLQAETAHWFYGNAAQFINMAGGEKSDYLASLQKELETRGAYTASRIVWGQKPDK